MSFPSHSSFITRLQRRACGQSFYFLNFATQTWLPSHKLLPCAVNDLVVRSKHLSSILIFSELYSGTSCHWSSPSLFRSLSVCLPWRKLSGYPGFFENSHPITFVSISLLTLQSQVNSRFRDFFSWMNLLPWYVSYPICPAGIFKLSIFSGELIFSPPDNSSFTLHLFWWIHLCPLLFLPSHFFSFAQILAVSVMLSLIPSFFF